MTIEKKGGIIVIIGGILTLISVLIPTTYIRWEYSGLDMDIYYWMWGFTYAQGTEDSISESKFAIEFYGCICAIGIIIASIIAILKGNTIRKGNSGGTLAFFMAIIAILTMISWIFAVELYYSASIVIFGEQLRLNFWDFFEFYIGVYTLFIGANLIIIGALIKMKID